MSERVGGMSHAGQSRAGRRVPLTDETSMSSTTFVRWMVEAGNKVGSVAHIVAQPRVDAGDIDRGIGQSGQFALLDQLRFAIEQRRPD